MRTRRVAELTPVISTTGSGEFGARITKDETAIEFELTYGGLESVATAAQIHVGQPGVNGGVSAFLCGGGDKPPCPPPERWGTP